MITYKGDRVENGQKLHRLNSPGFPLFLDAEPTSILQTPNSMLQELDTEPLTLNPKP